MNKSLVMTKNFFANRAVIVLVTLSAWSCFCAAADLGLTSEIEGWSLPELVEALKENNPQLRSAVLSTKALELGVLPAQAFDNPTLNVSQDPLKNSPFNVNSSTGMVWGLSQNFLWPGKKRLAGEIVQAQAGSSKEQVNQLKTQLLGQLKSTWINWQQTSAQVAITQSQVQRLEQIKEITKIRYANNAAAFSDYVNAQVAQSQLQTDLLGLERQQKVAADQIAMLVGGGRSLKLKTAVMTTLDTYADLDQLETLALDVNPQLKSSQFVVEAARKNVELAELGKLPDFNVGVLAHSASPPWGFRNNESYGMSFGVTLPLYYGQKEKNLIDQAKAYLSSAQEADASLRQQVVFGVRSAYHQWKQSLDQLKLIEERVFKQAQIGYRLTLANYSSSQASYSDLLNAFNTLKSTELSREQARSLAIQSKVTLEVAVGEID
jgi:cobalt-zinc-cadmium efflux system outer membrane protein